jgi:hypothetical protein
MNRSVAVGTQGDEIAIRVVALVASVLDMMDLESGVGAASLALPTVSLQDLPAHRGEGGGAQSQPRALGH